MNNATTTKTAPVAPAFVAEYKLGNKIVQRVGLKCHAASGFYGATFDEVFRSIESEQSQYGRDGHDCRISVAFVGTVSVVLTADITEIEISRIDDRIQVQASSTEIIEHGCAAKNYDAVSAIFRKGVGGWIEVEFLETEE